MDLFIQIAVNSLIVGSLYGTIAMGFSLAYRTTRFFNLAHGSMAAIGGYTFFSVQQNFGLPFIVCAFAGMLAAGIAGFLIDRFIFGPQRRRKASSSVLLVASLGVVTVVEAVIAMLYGAQFRALVPAGEISSFQIGPAFITAIQVWIIVINLLILGGLMMVLYKTRLGKMIRAIADDPDVAHTLGIRTELYIGIVFFLASTLAGLTGILYGLDTGLQPTMGFYLLLKAIIACIIGSAGNVPGAFLGGFVLAIVENTGVFTLGSEWRDAIAFVLLLVFLLFKPEGILGKRRD